MESCHQNLRRSSGSAGCHLALTGKLDVVATDHAPHLWSEKQGSCLKAASGGPLIQHSLQTMLELSLKGEFTIEQVVEKMCHAPATLCRIDHRGYLRSGYYADIVVVDPCKPYTVTTENILSKCKWSPFEGHTFPISIDRTFVNGNEVFSEGKVCNRTRGKRLTFHDNSTTKQKYLESITSVNFYIKPFSQYL